ncbi:MAG: hypothetical protein ABI361_08425 [Nitrososphaera sp.]
MDPADVNDIEVLGNQSADNYLSGMVTRAKKSLDCLFDARSLGTLSKIRSENLSEIASQKANGVKFRCVTEISKENLSLCKELMKDFELFHTPALSGSFLISDGQQYVAYLNGSNRLLKVTNKDYLDSQNFFMSLAIKDALPANQRIKEIGRGTGNEFKETLRDPAYVRNLISELLKDAVYEISILFSTKNSFLMAEREGILEEIGRASESGIKVRLLVMHDDAVKEITNTKLKAEYPNVRINFLQQLILARITTLIVDQAISLAVEVKDVADATFQDAVGLSTYSNSESTVYSDASIFESLWIQSEVDKQTQARQTYFQLFKGFKLKDEVYTRRWTSGEGERDEK